MGQCYVLLLAIFLVLFEKVRISVAKDTCNSDSDCKNARFTRKYCCRGIWRGTDRICRDVDWCNGRYCLSNSDCNGPGELCCVSNTCTFDCPSCESDKDCKPGQYCCYSKAHFSKTRCAVNCLGKYCSGRWTCGGSQECCRSDVCVNCSKPGCRNDYECASGQHCCKKDRETFCKASCIGATCATDDDCAGYSECCHDKRCVKCSNIKCSSNSHCASGYCCRGQFYGSNSRCRIGGCVGQSCDTSGDCGGLGECCRDNLCAHCSDSRCKDHTECPVGEYCCKRNGQAICSKSCVGLYCNSREDCAARGECCTKNKCTTSGCTCNSKADCKLGEYCCGDYTCSNSCIGKQCSSNSDCEASNETCTYPDSDCIYAYSGKKCPNLPENKCFNRNGCYSHEDCEIFGSGYYCCKEILEPSCNSNCINKFCNDDSDCGSSSECCNSKNKCQKCSNSFPKWLIGVIVGILLFFGVAAIFLYTKFKKRKTGRQEPTQSSPETVRRQNNQSNQARHSSSLQSTVDSTLVAEGQSTPLAQILARPSLPRQPLPYHSTEMINDPRSVKSGHLSVGNMSETPVTVVPSAPPAEYSTPSSPPPSYHELFGNR